MKRSIGIYPGTFDPVHRGHVAFAAETARMLSLDEVIFLPEPKPRRKTNVTDLSHRTALIAAATAENARLGVVNLTSDQFTVPETLAEIRQAFGDVYLTMLIGSDVARFLQSWDALDSLLKEVSLAIGVRAGDSAQDIAAIMDEIARNSGVPVRYQLITARGAGVSSSQIRRGLAGESHVHPSVAGYIKKHQLYVPNKDGD